MKRLYHNEFIPLSQKGMLRKFGFIILCLSCVLTGQKAKGQTSYNNAVVQGLRFQMQADSMLRMVEMQVMKLATASESQKNGIKIAIRDYDTQAVALQKQANEWFAQALVFEKASTTVVDRDTISVAETVDADAMKATESQPVKKVEPKNIQESEFAILAKSPYSAANPVPVDNPLPDGVVYKIQLGAFSKPVSASAFKGLTPLSGEKLTNGVTKYYVGMFRRFAEADDALRKVHEYGFKDAYIVAFYNHKTINPERAKQLESSKK